MHRQQVKKRMFLEFADKGDKVSHILWKSYKYRPEPSGSATLGNQPFMAQISVHLPNNPIARLPHAQKTGALLVRPQAGGLSPHCLLEETRISSPRNKDRPSKIRGGANRVTFLAGNRRCKCHPLYTSIPDAATVTLTPMPASPLNLSHWSSPLRTPTEMHFD